MRFLILIILFSFQLARAQHSVLSSALSTSARGSGQSDICNWSPVTGLMNPAHLSMIEYNGFGLESHNYFFIKGLYTFVGHGSYKINANQGVGINLVSDGSAELREWLFSISYGRKIGSKTGIGLSFDYLQTQTPESKNLRNVSFELGLQTQLLPSLLLGFVIKNLIPIHTATFYPYPTVFKVGLNYKVYEQLQVLAEAHKNGNYKTSFHGGLRYAPVLPLLFSIGVNTQGPSLSVGATYFLVNGIVLVSAFEHHTQLGISSSFGFTYQFK